MRGTRLYFENGVNLKSKSFQPQGGTNRTAALRNNQGATRPELSHFRVCKHFVNKSPANIYFIFSLVHQPICNNSKKKKAPNQSGTYQSSHSYCKGPECCPSPHGAREKALPPIGRAQSDFSFSFMCKKTMLNMKRPTIMEKAPA